MSIVEAVTVVLYRVAPELRPTGWRKGKPRRQIALAYRDAAWAKLRRRCRCTYGDGPDGAPVGRPCRYHDKEFRSGGHGYEEGGWHGFLPPSIWRLPRTGEPGYWDYGRAVAFRLARFYARLDARSAAGPVDSTDPRLDPKPVNEGARNPKRKRKSRKDETEGT